MAEFNKQWFVDRIADRELTAGKLAAMMGLSRSLMSKRLSGHIPITLAEAADMARMLGVDVTEIMRHSGISLPGGSKAKIVGQCSGLGAVVAAGKKGPKEIEVACSSLATLRGVLVGHDGALEGWVALFAPSAKLQPEAVGRLAIVGAGSKTWLGVLARGAARGRWNVADLAGAVLAADLAVESASPVQWVRT